MIKISVDYGYAFDMLSIIEVKNKIINNKDNYYRLYNEIKEQIGDEKINQILLSKEYKQLLEANDKVFKLVDKAQKDNGLAKEVDSANYQRYVEKTNLQRKFFNDNISEIKLGYSK